MDGISPASFQVAQKAALKGHLIKIATTRKCQKVKDIRSLMIDLDSLYHQHSRTPTLLFVDLIQQILSALDTLLLEKMEKSLRWSKAHFLLHSNSARFARKLKQSIQHYIPINSETPMLISHLIPRFKNILLSKSSG